MVFGGEEVFGGSAERHGGTAPDEKPCPSTSGSVKGAVSAGRFVKKKRFILIIVLLMSVPPISGKWFVTTGSD
jgi:hypothetical protein